MLDWLWRWLTGAGAAPRPMLTRVVGVTAPVQQAVLATLAHGDLLLLQAEAVAGNGVVVAVCTLDGRRVGYLGRGSGLPATPWLAAAGDEGRARVARLLGGTVGQPLRSLEIELLPPRSARQWLFTPQPQPAAPDWPPGLTPEQLQVVHHPLGRHARVLAVAGSGKTTTLAQRVKYLVHEQRVDPSALLVLMFNRLAREQFTEKLHALGLTAAQQPRVRTFHAFAMGCIADLQAQGELPAGLQFWTGARGEMARFTLQRALRELVQAGQVAADRIDIAAAAAAIALWKGALIPPQWAACGDDGALPLLYQRYEALRSEANALTFDDFVPLVVGRLEQQPALGRRWAGALRCLIVDEYQDVNQGQQRLIELLAGHSADVMVVGDDDQTIYEWRGARPDYIVHGFQSHFQGRPVASYTLSYSFRFGRTLAQAAQNVISANSRRLPKRLLARFPEPDTPVQLLTGDGDRQLADQAVRLLQREKVPSASIVVLGRTYAQLSGLQAEFLARGLPFQVMGQAPFPRQGENEALLDYLRLALDLDEQCGSQHSRQLLAAANIPNRYLGREAIRRAAAQGIRERWTVRAVLHSLASPDGPYRAHQRQRVQRWLQLLAEIQALTQRSEPPTAGDTLRWLLDRLHYLEQIGAEYGTGEEAQERRQAVLALVAYAQRSGRELRAFVGQMETLDGTQGQAAADLITMTSVHRSKGLEYDYVLIPACHEGAMPCLVNAPLRVTDRRATAAAPPPSAQLDNERRLFYVALTRAKRAVYIGVNDGVPKGSDGPPIVPSRFLAEMKVGRR